MLQNFFGKIYISPKLRNIETFVLRNKIGARLHLYLEEGTLVPEEAV